MSGSNTLTTGEDATNPPLKKRLLSRNVAGKVQTPKGSPNNMSPKVAGGGGGEQTTTVTKSKSNRTTTMTTAAATPTMHTLFAMNFFNNVSTGYNVLLHTFQYLKVQVSFCAHLCFFIINFAATMKF